MDAEAKRVASATVAGVLVLLAVTTALSSGRAQAAVYSNPELHYSLTYPDGWTALTYSGGEVEIRNFTKEKYLPTGQVPLGGAQIVVLCFPPYPRGLRAHGDEYAYVNMLAGRTDTITKRADRSHEGPAKVESTRETPIKTLNHDALAVVRKGGQTFQVSLEYQAKDPNGPAYERAFDMLLSSLSVGKTPAPTP